MADLASFVVGAVVGFVVGAVVFTSTGRGVAKAAAGAGGRYAQRGGRYAQAYLERAGR